MDLRSARQEKKLTQEELAEKSGLPQTTISDIERGAIKKPSWDAVARLCRALGMDPSDVFPIDELPKAVNQ
ncbi:MAG TPA: helix-turn-helix transcriptional regulator [Vicinamibacterales bacterium]|nr:helix-turn-helix transcriptional regulator [Vicinamibacterales bacterium]